ncbi:MAG TPA: TMEM175 family protein [Edaphocola sp.]|nr:TMEM175 family protein [Edaphocola sp.]
MEKGRLEAFSDGVFAIIITIMVLEIKAPETASFAALLSQLPTFISYILSFIYVGIYWNNHHHMFQLTERVNGSILWANLHLLFWLTLVPFSTAWMGNTHFAHAPLAVYGVNLLIAAIAYVILQKAILKENGIDSRLAKALGNKWKENLSPVLYILGIAVSFFDPIISGTFYVMVALIWLIPDKRIEKAFKA